MEGEVFRSHILGTIVSTFLRAAPGKGFIRYFLPQFISLS